MLETVGNIEDDPYFDGGILASSVPKQLYVKSGELPPVENFSWVRVVKNSQKLGKITFLFRKYFPLNIPESISFGDAWLWELKRKVRKVDYASYSRSDI